MFWKKQRGYYCKKADYATHVTSVKSLQQEINEVRFKKNILNNSIT